jgi:hypothetical protein
MYITEKKKAATMHTSRKTAVFFLEIKLFFIIALLLAVI